MISGCEDYILRERHKKVRQAYIEKVHAERLACIEIPKERIPDTNTQFERKAFAWKQHSTPLLGNATGTPDGGFIAEYLFTDTCKILKTLKRARGTYYMQPASMVGVFCALAQHTVPAPSGPRIRSNSPWHLVLTDVFFPAPFILDDGSESIHQTEEAPVFVHAVALNVNKEAGDIDAKRLLETIQFKAAPKYPTKSA